ncbi:glycosyltransferase family 2 protein [Candidatus Parcubacteria bacterium]|nr:MAG: glycosyltransferase family 2 protein [Candidatus Parcubacteria bacterium]
MAQEVAGCPVSAGKVSVYVLTYNEEKNLRECLESAKLVSDDIHVVDSCSSDKTLEIAEEYGCYIHQRKFDTFARQCNWALETIPFKHEWIIRLDADERIPGSLAEEIQEYAHTLGEDVTGVMFKKRLYFMGRWIRYGRMYPMLRLAMFRKGSGYYEDKEEEQYVLTRGRYITAKHDFYECNQNNTLPFFTMKHLDYAEDEVKEALDEELDHEITPKLFGNKIERTRWLKVHVYSHVPLFVRPWLYFFYRYFFCLGFLDGIPGLIFHTLQAFWYRFYVDARIYEMRSNWREKRLNFEDIR